MPEYNRPSAQSSKSAPPSRKVVLLSVGYALFFLVTLAFAYRGHLPIGWLTRFHNADKLGHLILYFIPSYLGHRLCQCKHLHRWRLPVFPSFFALFTITEELLQGLSPNRTLDVGDMACSLIGIVVGYWLAQKQGQKAKTKDAQPITAKR